jgi:hypothetical protein
MSAQLAQALRRIAEFNYSGAETPSVIARQALAAHEAAPQQEPAIIVTIDDLDLVQDWAESRLPPGTHKLYAAPQQAQAPTPGVCDLVQVEGLGKSSRSQHDADSAELRSLCKARDDARRERDMLRAELAGHEASGGHLSAMVDELRALLSEAMAMMKALHESASPDDGPEMNAIVPSGAFREFVDANAALMHKIHISPHGDGSAAPQQGSKPDPTLAELREKFKDFPDELAGCGKVQGSNT